ncbi:MAG: DUF1549 domain-containing protein [Kiritimatiellia bacterium]
MSWTRRSFLGGTVATAGLPAFAGVNLFGAAGAAVAAGEADDQPWEKADGRASNAVFVRRAYIDLAGRLPSKVEAQGYVFSSNPDRKRALVDELLAADSFADYWSMRFCDVLRVKSEFPINLWPNAVYVFHRRIRAFVKNDEPWDHFARAMLMATGSDFRDAEANFLRATARRTPEGYAEIAARTFLGKEWAELSEETRRELAGYFACVRIKSTREWKEEILLVEGEDRRAAFVEKLLGAWRDDFAKAFVQRVDYWFFGMEKPDPAHVKAFIDGGYRLRPLVRAIALSARYERGPVTGDFPYRRLDAEVLDDVICDLTDSGRDYQSIAPEPFTFLPKNRRSVLIEDGSISNAFLLLFGRPARDTGQLSERHNEVTAKQRLYLLNSGRIFQRLGRIVDGREYRRQSMGDIVQDLYWRFYSRAPTRREKADLLAHFGGLKAGPEKWRFPRDLAWCLLNSREFFFQH